MEGHTEHRPVDYGEDDRHDEGENDDRSAERGRADQMQSELRRAAEDPRVIGLAGGLPNPRQFPRRALAMSFLRALRQSGAPALQYGWAEGSERLRDFVADRLRARGAAVGAADVLITSGAQQAIAIALTLTCEAGDRVAVDAETYPAALELLRSRGLRAINGSPNSSNARVAYALPAVGNPRGMALSTTARRELLESRLPIVEDDAYADLRFDGPAPRPLIADAPNRVFHVGTLSKTICPGLRIGWLVVPAEFRRRALMLKQGDDLQANSLGQAIAEDYLLGNSESGRTGIDFDARLVRLRQFYRRRAEVLARALRAHLPEWRFGFPEGGFAIWAETDQAVDELEFLQSAVSAGVSFDPGSTFRPDGRATPTAVRLCFSLAPARQLPEAVRRLAVAWRRFDQHERPRGVAS